MRKEDKYPEFADWTWKSFSNRKAINIDEFVTEYYDAGRNFHVGSDSQVYGKKTVFATALIAHSPSTGGSVIICKDKVSHYGDHKQIRHRLIMEAMRTLEVAYYLDSILPEDAKIRLHVDVNNALKFKSGQYKEQLVGMIMGQGYISLREAKALGMKDEDCNKLVFWKPDSWAASSVADKRV